MSSRFVAALGFALVVGALVVAPVSASTTIGPTCSGTCGNYATYDQNGGPYGAICKYETGSYDLDWIKVNPPKMYGPYGASTKVQWKFNILRSKNFGGSYTGIYNASWQADTASSGAAANSFTTRTWNAPDPNPIGWFKVRILLRWKNAAGHTVGNAKVEYDHYQGKWNGNVDDRSGNDYCLQDW
ncbi:MAG: hypothetical protein ABI744_01155 [Chloroflexota bacterium]